MQPAAYAPFGNSLRRGERVAGSSALTIAVKRPGELTLELIAHWLDDLVCVGEDEIAQAMGVADERSKLVVEGQETSAWAALLEGTGRGAARNHGGRALRWQRRRRMLAAVARRHETQVGRRLALFTRLPDRPGSLAGLLPCVADAGANLAEVEHVREDIDLHLRETAVQLCWKCAGASTPSGSRSLLPWERRYPYLSAEPPSLWSMGDLTGW